ncbi:efflux RND transporter periplasmic adaptor subunit [Aliarcobacter cryaerophilus]|uniref:Efflux transporter periplasmic adaptor subunit n=1 Tax=Aliarcobacter cryaerophilus TaxID=28198 RepID=A0A2S9TP05_9BACT|nr:efflux RND transporter periplasmic adaptor subunit [Aliarcobacter cryaerophilus]PRN00560.1 efflux transporter periplasmic adaptor subunit [Arcobacter cryaerophilus gv. pseudocryaerophilus]
MKILYFFVIFLATNLFSIDEKPQARAVIHSFDKTILSSEIGGRIIFMQKNNGDYFEKNEVLVKIDCSIYLAEKDKIRVKRDLSKIKYEKTKQLSQYNSVGQFEVKTAELELQEQELELKIATINTERCEVKAPFNGRIVEKFVSKYQNIKPQEELYEIINTNSLEIRTVVPAKWLSWLKIGDEITINIDELNLNIKTNILQIDSVVDPKSQTVNVRAKIENQNSNIITGMSGTVTFYTSNFKR